jgi:hypothetical protein
MVLTQTLNPYLPFHVIGNGFFSASWLPSAAGRAFRCEIKVEGHARCNHSYLQQRVPHVRTERVIEQDERGGDEEQRNHRVPPRAARAHSAGLFEAEDKYRCRRGNVEEVLSKQGERE